MLSAALLGCAIAATPFVTGCVSKPTMKLNHAEVSGVRIGLSIPPQIGVVLLVVVDVYNPNSYDVAVRAVRGQSILANRYQLPVDFRADGDGLWLPSKQTTTVRVPVQMPVQLALAILNESYNTPMIPFRIQGKADVTATRTFALEKDDYSIDESGYISRQQIESAVRF